MVSLDIVQVFARYQQWLSKKEAVRKDSLFLSIIQTIRNLQIIKPRFDVEKFAMFGKTSDIWFSGSPNQRASVAAY